MTRKRGQEMTLDEAIKYCDEIAEVQDKLSKRCDDASGYSRSHNEAIRTNDAKEFEKCSQDFRQLAEWLKELKTYKEQQPCVDAISRKAMLEYQEYLHGKMSNDENHKLWEFIKGLSSVTPKNTERKTGEILTSYETYIDSEGFERRVKRTTYCALCKCDLGYNGDILAHYCPNCGVKLEYKGR